jgi:hypothetical protein
MVAMNLGLLQTISCIFSSSHHGVQIQKRKVQNFIIENVNGRQMWNNKMLVQILSSYMIIATTT